MYANPVKFKICQSLPSLIFRKYIKSDYYCFSYKDFIVHEIDLNGRPVILSNLGKLPSTSSVVVSYISILQRVLNRYKCVQPEENVQLNLADLTDAVFTEKLLKDLLELNSSVCIKKSIDIDCSVFLSLMIFLQNLYHLCICNI